MAIFLATFPVTGGTMKRLFLAMLCVALLVPGSRAADNAKRVYFVEPADGATVTSPFKVVFGVDGMVVEPAGAIKADSGHHHLLINTGPMKAGEPIPADDTRLHFGKGQTETMVTLAPGKYTLTAQFANGAHQSYGEAMSKTIRVTVK
jgi:hypothetical protein